jgi:hypothetical protein
MFWFHTGIGLKDKSSQGGIGQQLYNCPILKPVFNEYPQ